MKHGYQNQIVMTDDAKAFKLFFYSRFLTARSKASRASVCCGITGEHKIRLRI